MDVWVSVERNVPVEVGVPVELHVRVPVDENPSADAASTGEASSPPQLLVSVVAYAEVPPTIPAAASALNRTSPARESPRGGGAGAGVDARDSGHVVPQNGQRISVRRMWRAQEGQAKSRVGIGGVCAGRRVTQARRRLCSRRNVCSMFVMSRNAAGMSTTRRMPRRHVRWARPSAALVECDHLSRHPFR
jgi:hypothetical protein